WRAAAAPAPDPADADAAPDAAVGVDTQTASENRPAAARTPVPARNAAHHRGRRTARAAPGIQPMSPQSSPTASRTASRLRDHARRILDPVPRRSVDSRPLMRIVPAPVVAALGVAGLFAAAMAAA